MIAQGFADEVVVTGATSGIGLATALRLAGEGDQRCARQVDGGRLGRL